MPGAGLIALAGVYGLVAGIVKLDDMGAWLTQRAGANQGAGAAFQRALGLGLLHSAPWLMKALSVAGTIAMFLVGGGILSHGIPGAHHLQQRTAARMSKACLDALRVTCARGDAHGGSATTCLLRARILAPCRNSDSLRWL